MTVRLSDLTPEERERLERALEGQLMNVELYGLGDGRRLAPREVDKLAREVCKEVRR